MNFTVLKNRFAIFIALILGSSSVYAADSATMQMSFTLDSYLKITPVTSPVLIANITDRTGNLAAPLQTKFKVITNMPDSRTLYLQATTTTESGEENAMFSQGGRVYLAFSNVLKPPKTQSLANCINGGQPKDSPGVVAYPITSIQGTQTQYIPSKRKYEVYVENGTTFVTVNVGTNVLRSSFAPNDPKGFYKVTLALTEVDL